MSTVDADNHQDIAPDARSLDDYEQAARILLCLHDGQIRATDSGDGWMFGIGGDIPGVIGRAWIQHAIEHLARKTDLHFREFPRLDTEKQAMVELKRLAFEWDRAGAALLVAAEKLKAAGQGHAASQAYVAGKTARTSAQRYLG